MKNTKAENIVGQRIGIYDVLYECDFRSKDGHRMYHIKCSECGWETDMQYRWISDAKKCTHITLGGYYIKNYKWQNDRIGNIFSGMKDRCYNPTERSYRWYGAKGIKIYDEWLNNPKSFEEWALENGYNDNLTINRKDEDKDYCPENCEWVSLEYNSKYKSTTHLITVNGITHTGREWSETLGLGTNTINKYVRNYGEDKTKQLIDVMLNSEPKHRKSHSTWFKTYGIN